MENDDTKIPPVAGNPADSPVAHEEDPLGQALVAPPAPIPPEKRTWADYMARGVQEMLAEAMEYAKSVEHPENLKGVVILFDPLNMHKPENLMSTSDFDIHMGRARVTDPEVIFMARYLENDVFLHYIGVRGSG